MKKYFKLKHLQIVVSVITIVSMVVPYNFQPVLAATDLATIDNVPLVETEVIVEPVAETPTVLGEEVSVTVTICHATGAGTYETLHVDSHAIGGHFDNPGTPKAGHEDDLYFADERECPQPTPPTESTMSTVIADKIVCRDESYLPNWSGSGHVIDNNTAANFLSNVNNQGGQNCWLQSGWDFQWAYEGVENPGDSVDDGGTDWLPFGYTDANGRTQTTVNISGHSEIRVREVFQDGYLPFSGASSNDSNSAEIWCTGDVLNYDNFDWIRNPQDDNTYYCVAFNVQLPPETGSIHGQKWNDVDGNGQRGEEPALGGVTITATLIGDLQFASSTVTDEQGNYSLGNLPYGDYDVCEETPTGWTQTYPEACHLVTVNSSNSETFYDFGNQELPSLCGNQRLDQGEQCDDGNNTNDDGCSATCQLETASSCDQPTGAGWWAEYFNYSREHQDMNIPDVGDNWPDAGHGDPMGASWDTDWYDSEYFRFARVDSSLNYGDNYFPFDFAIEEDDIGHEYHFGVHWRAKVTAPSDNSYSYNLRTDDDSWVYVDGALFDSGLAGIHAPTTSTTTTMYLTAGDHTVDVFFAERHTSQSAMTLVLDDQLTITPLPKDCPNMCVSKLDFVDVDGNLTPDEDHGLGDATAFTSYYLPALGTTSTMPYWNEKADVNSDGIVNVKDYLCADKYYSTGLYDGCLIDCSDICSSPLDYDKDYQIGLGDGTTFTAKYETSLATTIYDAEVDLNDNGYVDYGDYSCANQYIATGDYQCNLSCQATCGDKTTQKRLGESCDDGNITNGDGCNQFCRTETNQCDEPNVLDYDGDYEFTFDDAVLFGTYYLTDDIKADVNNNDVVDYGDKLCADPYYKNGLAYTCTIGCEEYTPVCGDTHKDAGEQCDDGNNRPGDGCSATCQSENDIHGYKWNDLNGNGLRDCPVSDLQSSEALVGAVCEPLLAGWTIFIDENNDGILNGEEQSTTTSASVNHLGWYWFENLPAGDYRVCEVVKNHWTQTYPIMSSIESYCHNVTLPDASLEQTLNAVLAPEHNFGNHLGAYCGDAIVNNQEVCDAGADNGKGVGFCKADCSGIESSPITPSGGGGGGGGGGSSYFYVSLQVDKTVTPTAVEPGSQLTYNVKITNRGNMIGANLTLKDTLPAGFTFADNGTITKEWSWDTISPNQTMEVTYKVNVSSTAANGTYTNTAVADVTNGPATQDTANVRVGAPSVLGINTEVVPPAAPNAPAGENVQVLGFEELPNTSGGFSLMEMLAIFMSLASGMYLASRLIVDKKRSTR